MISDSDLTRVLAAAAVLLVAAYTVGTIFERLRQPRVVGEIVGGLLVGPTVLGAVAPGAVSWLFPSGGAHSAALGLLQQLGLLLLLFCAGSEVRAAGARGQRRRSGIIATVGMVIPAAVAVGLLAVYPLREYRGPSANHLSFLLVTCVAFAVTSIPVISRIMSDLGIIGSSFAGTVLGVAIIEDVVVYVTLAIAVAVAAPTSTSRFGLSHWLGLSPGSGADIAVHVAATLLLLAGVIAGGRPVLRLVGRFAHTALRRGNPLTARLVVLVGVTLVALVLGVETYLAAFAAGIAVARTASGAEATAHQLVIKRFSYAFFVPIYFALVGATLDLRHGFDLALFTSFLLCACVVKGASVYVGARVSGVLPATARDLAVALNARGGPGIVLATVAYGAAIIDRQFYAVLVLLAVLTSLLAGGYLARRPASVFASQPELITAAQP